MYQDVACPYLTGSSRPQVWPPNLSTMTMPLSNFGVVLLQRNQLLQAQLLLVCNRCQDVRGVLARSCTINTTNSQ